jgi:hypothetical protein
LIGGFGAWGCGDDSTDNTPEELNPNNTTNNSTNNSTNDGTNNLVTTTNNGTNGGSNNGSNNGTNNTNNMTGGEPNPDSVTLPDASQFDYSAEAVFTIDGLIGGYDGAQEGDNPGSVVCRSGCESQEFTDGSVTMQPIDTGFGFTVKDFIGAAKKDRDGVYDDGWVGTIRDNEGNPIGIAIANDDTVTFKTGPGNGAWCSGVGASPVKCIAEHYVVAEHALTCHETIPYMYYNWMTGEPTADYTNCPPLDDNFDRPLSELETYQYDIVGQAFTESYAMRLGDHPGEWKMVWGDTDKRPTDVRFQTTIPVPAEFKTGGPFNITRAELAIVHTITNNPNDQIRPEDESNEGAGGLKPGYTVDSEGRWLSSRDCIEGDGDVIPAGTVFKNPSFAEPNHFMEDVRDGFTNAWYTTTDRNPFVWDGTKGPRWRLKAPKMGQDLPELEIPVEPCTPYPLKKDQIKYTKGDMTVTHINLLDPEDGVILFPTSEKFTQADPAVLIDGSTDITVEGARLTDDFDVVVYIKGDKKPVRIYKAVLYLDYEPAN